MRALALRPRAPDSRASRRAGWTGVEEVAFLFTEPESTPGSACSRARIHRVPRRRVRLPVRRARVADRRHTGVCDQARLGRSAAGSSRPTVTATARRCSRRATCTGSPTGSRTCAGACGPALSRAGVRPRWIRRSRVGGTLGRRTPARQRCIVDGQDPRRPTGLTYRQLTAGDRAMSTVDQRFARHVALFGADGQSRIAATTAWSSGSAVSAPISPSSSPISASRASSSLTPTRSPPPA